jgi:hypothetical protein
MITLKRWGIIIGKLHIVWYDMWSSKFSFEISWY